MRLTGLIIPFLLLLSLSAVPQEIVHYTTADGLSGTDVSAICADENYLWIATNDGLNCFDGKTFKVYRHDDRDDGTLTESNIETLMFDSAGNLWMGFKTGGVDIFDPRHNKVTHVDNCPQRVMSICEDSRGNVWLGSWEDGLRQLIPDKNSSGGYRMLTHYPGNTIVSIIEKPAGKLWIGTYYGYFLYDIDNQCDIPVNDTPHAVTQLLDTGDENSLWMSTWNGGVRRISWSHDFSSVSSTPVTGSSDDIYRMISSETGELYLASWGDGIKVFDPDTRRYAGTCPVNAPVAMSFFRDRYGKLWIGSYGMGLFCINSKKRGISSVPLHGGPAAAAYVVTPFNDHSILVGTQGDGLYLYDSSGHGSFYRQQQGSDKFFTRYILSLYKDDDLVIVGNDDEGIGYIPLQDPAATKLDFKTMDAYSKLGKVTAIYRDDNGIFWIGTKQTGMYSLRYDTGSQKFVNCRHYDLFGANEITGLCPTIDGQLWVASHGGIFRFDPSARTAVPVPGVSGMIYAMANDTRNHCLWLGTSVGIKRIDYNVVPIAVQDVFTDMVPRESIRDIVLDDDNNLWFSSTDRVFCHTDVTRELKEINLRNDTPHSIYSASLCNLDAGQRIVFGCDDRLLIIDPREVLYQPNHTKILLTRIEVNHRTVNVGDEVCGQVILDSSPEYADEITLSHECRWIDLTFAEVGWDNYQNRYQYRLKGLSDEWAYLDMTQPISFSQLNPGKYSLLIRPLSAITGIDNTSPDSVWSLTIVVTPPWWQTTTFYILLIIGITTLGTLLFYLLRRHYRRIQEQRVLEIEKRKKEEILSEKENFFTGLSHDLLTSFSLILAPTADLLRDESTSQEQKEKLNIVFKNAEFLAEIFRSILDYKRAELSDREIRLDSEDIVAHLRMTISSFEYMARAAGLTLSFYHDGIESLIAEIDRIKLERILCNLIGNAVKYTPPGGDVSVTLTRDSDAGNITITVADTGIGIKAGDCDKMFDKFYRGDNASVAPGLGLGLYTTGRFIDAMGGTVHVEPQQPQGTVVSVTLPIAETHRSVDSKSSVADSGRFNVLLVEDNPQMATYLKNKLSMHFDVTVASDGMEAMEIINRNMPELVISDVMMPRMSGLELCRKIKETPVYSDIFVILLSARSTAEDEVEGYRAGADFYFKKPFDPDVLISQLNNIYSTWQQRRKQLAASMIASPESTETTCNDQDFFIKNAVRIVEAHLMDENFKVDEFAAEMNMSKTVLNRKFKHLIGETPNTFIRNIRLHKAAVMLKSTSYSISEIAYMTGFGQTHYFIKRFKELYNETPGYYRQQEKPDTETQP